MSEGVVKTARAGFGDRCPNPAPTDVHFLGGLPAEACSAR